MTKQEQKVMDGAQPFMDEGERMLAAIIARPRGWTQGVAGAAGPGQLAANLGRKKQAAQEAAGEQADFQLASPMALGLTDRRLLVFGIGSPVGMGVGGEVKELVSAVPLDAVDSIEIKRLLLGKVVTVTVRGTPIKLEVNAAGDAKGLAEQFEQAKAAVV